MKKNSQKFNLTLVCLLFLITVNSCQKEKQGELLPKPQVHEAKSYVNSYLNKSETNIFSKMDINWENGKLIELAKERVLEVSLINTDRIFQTSSIINKVTDQEQRSNIRLVVLKDKLTDKVTNAVYMSIINDGALMDLTKVQYKSASRLTGKIMFYDLSGQFINGWHYTNGVIDQTISKSTVEAYKLSSTSKQQVGLQKLNSLRNDNKVSYMALPDYDCYTDLVPTYGVSCVGVEGYMNCSLYQNGSTYVTHCEYNGGGGGNEEGGGVTPGHGGGGSGGGDNTTQTDADLAAATVVDDGKPKIADIKKYIDCFTDGKQTATYTMTIYIDQPVANSTAHWVVQPPNYQIDPSSDGIGIKVGNTNLDVGHAFICFEKNNTDGTNVRQTIGFYPGSNPFNSKGAFKDDSGHSYDVSITRTVNALQFNTALTSLSSQSADSYYNLYSYNCTDAAIGLMNDGGANLSSVPRGSFNNTPGDFGQALRVIPSANKNGGNAITGKGPCN